MLQQAANDEIMRYDRTRCCMRSDLRFARGLHGAMAGGILWRHIGATSRKAQLSRRDHALLVKDKV